MANPTTNFGWVMPTSASLVTNLPADFNTFGQAVDTSMAQLKGGTTGQILSKTSATDMAFTWITNDVGDITAVTAGTGISGGGTSGAVTVTNSMATAITTAGDLIKGTGSGTFDRLGIGSTGQVLTVSSGAPSWATPSSGGLVHLNTTTGTGVTSISIGSNASPLFSSTYDNYKIIIVCDSDSSASSVNFRLRANTTDLTGANYNNQNVGGADTTAFAQRSLAATSAKVMDNHTTDYTNSTEILLTNPFNARNKSFTSNSISTRNTLGAAVNSGYIDSASSYNGITILSADNINNATIYIYGLAK